MMGYLNQFENMRYLDRDALQTHEQRARADAAAILRRQRPSLRFRVARFLVLTGARLIPERPTVIGDSVIVLTPSEHERQRDRILRQAA